MSEVLQNQIFTYFISLVVTICRRACAGYTHTHVNKQTSMITQNPDQPQPQWCSEGNFGQCAINWNSETSRTPVQDWNKQRWHRALTPSRHSSSRRVKRVHLSSQVVTARPPSADPGWLVDALNDSQPHSLMSPGHWRSPPERRRSDRFKVFHSSCLNVEKCSTPLSHDRLDGLNISESYLLSITQSRTFK